MIKYNVVFAMNYVVETDDENEAIDKAEELFIEDFENMHYGLTEMFGVNAEIIKGK